ncbi:DegV family protein [Amycolatopsis sp. NPDC059657]|uniref:DegV family protein n=1 Tax=Amycolatopsis sp. NPDC059657 TaxID=3346899 RepID=UPI0036707D33
MPAHVAVITDSTACLPEHLAAQWGVAVVQVQLQVGATMDDEHRIGRQDLIDAMKAGTPVTTAPPDTGAFFWAFQEAASSGASSVVSIHLSGRMSATVQAAREAAQQVRIPVHVLDSQTTGMSLGFAAISAARAAGAGAQARRVIDAAEQRFRTSTEFIYVDTLEYLRRGGRIGGAQAWIGTKFAIKPVLTVRGGEVAPLARVPGARRAISKMTDLAIAAAGSQPVDIAVTRFGSDERFAELSADLVKRIPNVHESHLVEASAIIGAHVGPGALGITVSPVGG